MAVYNKTVWTNGDTITASKLNNIENGIYNINASCNSINNKIYTMTNTVSQIHETIAATNQRIDDFISTIMDLDLDTVIARLNDAVIAIQTNSENIASNASGIATNVSNISVNSERIDALESNQGTPITAEQLSAIFNEQQG